MSHNQERNLHWPWKVEGHGDLQTRCCGSRFCVRRPSRYPHPSQGSGNDADDDSILGHILILRHPVYSACLEEREEAVDGNTLPLYSKCITESENTCLARSCEHNFTDRIFFVCACVVIVETDTL